MEKKETFEDKFEKAFEKAKREAVGLRSGFVARINKDLSVETTQKNSFSTVDKFGIYDVEPVCISDLQEQGYVDLNDFFMSGEYDKELQKAKEAAGWEIEEQEE